MSFWRTFYHIVWATKDREPMITPQIENIIFPSIIRKAREMDAVVYVVNGTVDHVHLVVAIPPCVAVAKLVGEVKGRSSYAVGQTLESAFGWQVGYGVHTFGERQLPWVIAYVRDQKVHHAADTIHARLETWANRNEGPPGALPWSEPHGYEKEGP